MNKIKLLYDVMKTIKIKEALTNAQTSCHDLKDQAELSLVWQGETYAS